MDDHLIAALGDLEYKIIHLLAVNKVLQSKLENVSSENQQLKEDLKKAHDELNNFHNKSKISKIVEYVAVDNNTAELKNKINEYIKEIDKCIAHLSE